MRRLAYVGTLVITNVLGILVLAVVGGTEMAVKPHVAILTCVASGLLPIVAVCMGLFNAQRAAQLHVVTIPPSLLGIVLYSWKFGFAGSLIIFLGVSVLPTLYWRIRLKGNSTAATVDGAFQRNWVLGFAAGLCSLSVLFALVLALFLPWWSPIGDCSGIPLLDGDGRPVGQDFTGQVVFVGPESFRGRSLWAVIRVNESFSKPEWRVGKLVIVRAFWKATDKQKVFFVEGLSSNGALLRVFPVIERMECGHTAPVEQRKAAIEVLRHRPTSN
jgi:hypothetical protein